LPLFYCFVFIPFLSFQVSSRETSAPRQKKREATAINPVKRPKKTVSAAEIAYRQQLKSLQDELKTVKSELREVSRTEKQLNREIKKSEAELEKLAEKEASLK
jgi:septal ring factor EnvC (AmiA/AmiB activator)